MSVEKIKEYGDTLKVILKPTRNFPEGKNYFYCSAENINLVQSYCWLLHQNRKNIEVVALDSQRNHYQFHRELANKHLGYYPDCLDHINGVEFDNVNLNLNIVTPQQNSFNRPTRGYKSNKKSNVFYPRITCSQIFWHTSVKTEIEACIIQYELETTYLKSLMGDHYYMYDFLKDRRNDLDILDLERTKKISSYSATYQHVLKYAKDNAWYYYRYNLANYFRDNWIAIPKYSLDSQGFMVHPITGQYLCPFN